MVWALLSVCLLGQQEPASTKAAFEINPFLDLYFAARSGSKDVPEPVRKTALAVSPDGRGLVSGAAIDAVAASSRSLEAFKKAAADLPESQTVGETTVNPRATALELCRAFEAWGLADREQLSQRRLAGLNASKTTLEQAFARSPSLLESALSSLGLKPKNLTIPIVLVGDAALPGAITYRVAPGKSVCVVSVSGVAGPQLIERALHEALHAADTADPGPDSVLSKLRAALQSGGKPLSRAGAEAIHAVIFAQAGATVKRLLNKQYQPYGEAKGVYARMTNAGRVAVESWNAHLNGDISADEAIKKIVAACNAG